MSAEAYSFSEAYSQVGGASSGSDALSYMPATQFVAVVHSVPTKTETQWTLQISTTAGQTVNVQADLADGLFIQPQPGDQVLCVELADRLLITQVLVSAKPQQPVCWRSARKFDFQAPSLSINTVDELELVSAGKLSLYGRDMVVGAVRTLVSQAKHLIQHAGDFALNAKSLLRIHSKQQIITAQEDIRIDGKRINMG
jgi:hypothetical protein